MSEPTKKKILYMHGIDGSPASCIKAKYLRKKGYEVLVPDMSEIIRLTRVKSTQNTNFNKIMATLLSIISVNGIFKNIYISGVRNLERLCIEVQMKALKDYQPDIVIGSSWGGNICLRLINQGHWKGPTILLAPAQQLVSLKSGREIPTIPKSYPSPIHIYHAKEDAVVPISHSEDLVRAYDKAKLFYFTNDDHACSRNITQENIEDLITTLLKEVQ